MVTGVDHVKARIQRSEVTERSRRQVGMLAGAAVAVAVLAAACSGSASPGGSSLSHPPGYQQYHAYSQCMRSHGARFWPEPSEVPQGVWDNPNTYKITSQILAQEHGRAWQAAVTACHRLAPRELPYTAAQIGALLSHLEKLTACMRAHGITHFSSPVAGPYGAGFRTPGPGVDPDSSQFQAAQRACWVYAPGS
jgi:hypothetical protein